MTEATQQIETKHKLPHSILVEKLRNFQRIRQKNQSQLQDSTCSNLELPSKGDADGTPLSPYVADPDKELFKNIQMFRPSKLIMKEQYPQIQPTINKGMAVGR